VQPPHRDDLRKHSVEALSLLAAEPPVNASNAPPATVTASGSRIARGLTEGKPRPYPTDVRSAAGVATAPGKLGDPAARTAPGCFCSCLSRAPVVARGA
jgi:hypothetical protein